MQDLFLNRLILFQILLRPNGRAAMPECATRDELKESRMLLLRARTGRSGLR
jgi:hypothetical protein